MKLNRLLCAVAVVVLGGMFAGTAKADIDPVLHAGDPACTAGSIPFMGSTISISLDEANGFDQALCYGGSTPLEQLTLSFIAPFGITFQFTGGTTAQGGPFPDVPDLSPLQVQTLAPPCDPTAPLVPCDQFNVSFFGPPGLLPGNGVSIFETPVGDNPLVPIVISVSAPESSTLPLLVVALVPLVWFGRKFRGVTNLA